MASALVGLGILSATAMARGGFSLNRYPSQIGGGAGTGEMEDVQATGAGRDTSKLLGFYRENGELKASKNNVMNDPYINSVAMVDPVLESIQIRGVDMSKIVKGSKVF